VKKNHQPFGKSSREVQRHPHKQRSKIRTVAEQERLKLFMHVTSLAVLAPFYHSGLSEENIVIPVPLQQCSWRPEKKPSICC
jgi:hypothetical protein